MPPTFNHIFEDKSADFQFDHHVDSNLLQQAGMDGIDSVRSDMLSLLENLTNADDVL